MWLSPGKGCPPVSSANTSFGAGLSSTTSSVLAFAPIAHSMVTNTTRYPRKIPTTSHYCLILQFVQGLKPVLGFTLSAYLRSENRASLSDLPQICADVKGHIRSKHPHAAALLSRCETKVRALPTSRPYVWCGKDFKRRDAHLRHCLVPCVCMLLEHLLRPTRPDAGGPSLHDVRLASLSLETR